MPNGEIRAELVDVAPTLQGVIDEAGLVRPGERIRSLRDTVDEMIRDVARDAYIAGVTAMAGTVDYYGSTEDVADRLILRAQLAGARLKDKNPVVAHPAEVTELLKEVSSFIPFAGDDCMRPEGFTDETRKMDKETADSLIRNFKLCDDDAWAMIAAEMGFRYAEYLDAQGVMGNELISRVRSFELRQRMIIRESCQTGELRQPDQDEHSYVHYLEQLSGATEPVWRMLSGRPRGS